MPWSRSLGMILIVAGGVSAADWPQWLGPHRDGSSPEKVAPWQGELKVMWRQPAGEGNSGPVVAGGKVFLFTKVQGKPAEQLTAYDAESGQQLWRTAYSRPQLETPFGNGPRATPAISGGRIFTYGLTGIVTCFDAGTGRQVWQVDAAKMFSPPKLVFGASCSPLVDHNAVLINVGAKGASVVALPAGPRKVLWQKLDDGAS